MSSKANGGATKAAQSQAQKMSQEGGPNSIPSNKELEDLERQLQKELIRHENDIYITETKYIRQTQQPGGTGGNVFKGWEGSSQTTHKSSNSFAMVSGSNRRHNRQANQEKFFSLSSLSAPTDDDNHKSFVAFLDGQPSCFDNMQYFGQYVLSNGQESAPIGLTVTTRTSSQQNQPSTHHQATVQRQNSKTQKSTPKGAVPQQTVKSMRAEATITRQQSSQASPEMPSKQVERSSRRAGRNNLRSAAHPSTAPVNEGSSSRKERASRQESQGNQEPPAMFMIEKQHSTVSQQSLSQQATIPASAPLIAQAEGSNSSRAQRQASTAVFMAAPTSMDPEAHSASQQPSQQLAQSQPATLTVAPSSTQIVVRHLGGNVASSAQESSYASGTGRGKGKGLSDSEDDTMIKRSQENTAGRVGRPEDQDIDMKQGFDSSSVTAANKASSQPQISIMAAAQQVVITAPVSSSVPQYTAGQDTEMRDEQSGAAK